MLTWQFSVHPQQYWGKSRIPGEIAACGVHYTDEFKWTRSLWPGDELTIAGKIVQLLAHRSGTYVRTRFVGVDASDQRVFTEHVRALLGDARPLRNVDDYVSKVPGIAMDTSREPVRTVRLPIYPLATHVYDGCANIHNPIHTSKAFAQSVGLPDIILHGTATLAYAICRSRYHQFRRWWEST